MNSQKNKNILLITQLPPPVGGVSIFGERLFKALKIHYKIKIISYKFNSQNRLMVKFNLMICLLKSIIEKYDLLICNISDRYFIPLFAFLSRVKSTKSILYLHSYRIEQENLVKKILLYLGLIMFKKIVIPSIEVKKSLSKIFPKHLLEKLVIIPSFILPDRSNLKEIQLPDEIENFIKKHSPILVANAYKIVIINGKDIYGIDTSITLLKDLKKYYKNIGFIFFLPDLGENKNYFNHLNKRIEELGVRENFLWVRRPEFFLPVLMRSDLFLRPTLTDSFGISVAEAIYLGIPAIASDICKRANGTIIYKTGKYDDLLKKVKNTLAKIKSVKDRLSKIKITDFSMEHIKLVEDAFHRF